jgi:hypothetical protein
MSQCHNHYWQNVPYNSRQSPLHQASRCRSVTTTTACFIFPSLLQDVKVVYYVHIFYTSNTNFNIILAPEQTFADASKHQNSSFQCIYRSPLRHGFRLNNVYRFSSYVQQNTYHLCNKHPELLLSLDFFHHLIFNKVLRSGSQLFSVTPSMGPTGLDAFFTWRRKQSRLPKRSTSYKIWRWTKSNERRLLQEVTHHLQSPTELKYPEVP